MRAALLGKPLGHSYSKIIHEKLGYPYDLLEIGRDELEGVLRSGRYDGFNVTIPYKRDVIPLLDSIDGPAREIGAVNTVKAEGGRLIGYNTDLYGLEYILRSASFDLKGERVMILGTGGTSLTAQAAARRAGAKEIYVVGRQSDINYTNCYGLAPAYIINTTPVGMYPNVDACPIEVERFSSLKGVADVIYNPLCTELVMRARAMGVTAVGGLGMLAAQGVYASEIFGAARASEELISSILRDLRGLSCSVAFIGMPGSGKSTLAKMTAEYMGKEFIDTDTVIENMAGKTIPEIFAERGEDGFRDIEEGAVRAAFCKNAVVATGGGAVLREKNRINIRRNSVVIWVRRNADHLDMNGRPLSKSRGELNRLAEQRYPFYRDLADFSVDNDAAIEDAFFKIKEFL